MRKITTNIKKYLKKVSSVFVIPVIVLVICLYIFEDYLWNYNQFITYLRYVLFGIIIIGLIGAITELIDKKKWIKYYISFSFILIIQLLMVFICIYSFI